MNELVEQERSTIYHHWSQMVVSILKCHKAILEAQWRAYFGATEEPIPAPPVQESSPRQRTAPASVKELEALAIERIRKGLAPPREIYEVPYRCRIDWFLFPEWARPLDPELFEECTHEG
jgi:hypothetical protein